MATFVFEYTHWLKSYTLTPRALSCCVRRKLFSSRATFILYNILYNIPRRLVCVGDDTGEWGDAEA